MKASHEKQARPARGLYARYAVARLLITLCTAATVSSAGLIEVNSLVTIVKQESRTIPNLNGALDNVKGGGPQTLLVLGSDRRFVDVKADNPVRSDTLMLVRLDPEKAATAVMSIRATSRSRSAGGAPRRSTRPTRWVVPRSQSRRSATC